MLPTDHGHTHIYSTVHSYLREIGNDASMSNKPFTYVTIGKLEVLMLMLLLYIMLFDASIRCRDQRRQDNRNSVDDG
jgi:hypothetical protein